MRVLTVASATPTISATSLTDVLQPQQLNSAVEPTKYSLLSMTSSRQSDIARDELTRALWLLEHACHVPAVGALVRCQPRLTCNRRDAHHFVHRGSTAWAWQSAATAPTSG